MAAIRIDTKQASDAALGDQAICRIELAARTNSGEGRQYAVA
jgi:hypothetical protein